MPKDHPLYSIELLENRRAARRKSPRVWAVLCDRQGENAQVLALAEALGWPFEIKRLSYRRFGFLSDVFRPTTLLGIRQDLSSPLEPPWPDLIISAAMRNEPVCRWIQKQADKPVRYVHVGRPWARLDKFDLVVTAPEYRLPDRSNVLHNDLSLTHITKPRLADAAAVWAPRFAHLPRPYIALLVGGYGGPYALGHDAARRLGRRASALAREVGGSLLVTASRRTAPGAMDALEAAIDVPAHVYRWTPDALENPFYGYLALAESFIVTCDSATMLAEACATRRPVYMFDPGPGDFETGQALEEEVGKSRRVRWPTRCDIDHAKAVLYRKMLRIPPQRMTRDIRLVHRRLIDAGRVAWLDEAFPTRQPPPVMETRRAVERVEALFMPEEYESEVDMDPRRVATA